jgi:hypothetical protein
MPELTQESTSPPEVAIPAVINPDRYEDFPFLRETFLLYVSDPSSNAALRGMADLLFTLILEYWGQWPNQPEGLLRASLRAAVADMRSVQGFLANLAGPDNGYDTPHEDHLAEVGGDVAREIGLQADRLEKELGTWRG